MKRTKALISVLCAVGCIATIANADDGGSSYGGDGDNGFFEGDGRYGPSPKPQTPQTQQSIRKFGDKRTYIPSASPNYGVRIGNSQDMGGLTTIVSEDKWTTTTLNYTKSVRAPGYGWAGGGSGGSSSSAQNGFMGADGQVHVGPSDTSPVCDCRAINTTYDKDSSDQAAAAAAEAATYAGLSYDMPTATDDGFGGYGYSDSGSFGGYGDSGGFGGYSSSSDGGDSGGGTSGGGGGD